MKVFPTKNELNITLIILASVSFFGAGLILGHELQNTDTYVTAFVTLAATFIGAYIAFKLQSTKELNQQALEKEAGLVKAIILCRHYLEVSGKIQQQINRGGKKLNWHEVNVIGIYMSSSLEQDIPSLIFHLGKKHGELIEDLLHAEWVAKSVITLSSGRDVEYRELQNFLIAEKSSRKLTEAQAKKIIGDPWAAKLESITAELHNAVDTAIELNTNCIGSLGPLLSSNTKI